MDKVHTDFDFEEHFSMVLAAPRKSGKSYFIKTFIHSKHAETFEHIFIMCPSIDFNNDYWDLEKDPRVQLINQVDIEVIDDLYRRQSDCKKIVIQRQRDGDELPKVCPSTLLILDDCVDSGAINFRGVVDKIAERGRHINMSCMIAAQSISSVSVRIRKNSDYFMVFSPYSMHEMESFVEQFVSKTKKAKLMAQLPVVFDTPFAFILVDNTEKNTRYKLKMGTAENLINKGEYTLI